MRRPRPPLFLARAVYRIRRLRDAARLLPVVGLFLMLMPLLWGGTDGSGNGGGNGGGIGGGGAVVFVFVVWALLIAGAALLAPALEQPDEADPAPGDGPG